MNQMGDYQIFLIKQEVALFFSALTWLKTSWGLAIQSAQKAGDTGMVELFESFQPVLEVTQTSLMTQAVEQSRSLGTSAELQSEMDKTGELFQVLQESALGLQYQEFLNKLSD